MTDDYRRTRYCPKLDGLETRKKSVADEVLKDYPNAEDMHTYISKNDERYKLLFMEAYHGKCSYCGVSLALISKRMFEIDHFIYEKSPKFRTKKEAGYIENLVLACQDCNRNKSSFVVDDESFAKLYPDGDQITSSFVRDDMYYIRISDAVSNDLTIKAFYEQLKLGNEMRRLDYLLMSMLGLKSKLDPNSDVYSTMVQAIELLRSKRNIMSC